MIKEQNFLKEKGDQLEFIVRESRSYLYAVIGFCLWMLVQSPLINWLYFKSKVCLLAMNRTLFAGVIISIITCFIVCHLYRFIRYRFSLSHSDRAFLLFFLTLYSYYRFCPTSFFVFWGWGQVCYTDVVYLYFLVICICDICAFANYKRTSQEQGDRDDYLLRDDAIGSMDIDSLGYQSKVDDLVAVLRRVDLSIKAFSVGIVGEWGIGKSSFLNLFAVKQKKDGQIVIYFNPRESQSIGQIPRDFFKIFSCEIAKYDGNLKPILRDYTHALNLHQRYQWLYRIFEVCGLFRNQIEKNVINERIKRLNKRIYVIIEDLDRLSGLEILEVLKLIDAYGSFCGVVYISAYDKKYVNKVLHREFHVADIKSDFTDKYFQYEYTLPKLHWKVLAQYMEEHMYAWLKRQEPNAHFIKEMEESWDKVFWLIYPGLSSLRHVKRFINLWRMSYPYVKDKVVFPDYTLMTYLRYMEPKCYWAIYDKNFTEYKGRMFFEQTSLRLKDDIASECLKYPKIPKLKEILRTLFPTDSEIQFGGTYNCISRAISFDNYFYDALSGRIYYEQCNRLINMPSLDEVYNTIRGYCSVEEQKNELEEFLYTRKMEWIINQDRLHSYVRLLIITNSEMKYSSRYIVYKLNDMFRNDTANESIEHQVVKNKEEYISCILGAFEDVIKYASQFICQYLIARIKENRDELNKTYKVVFDTVDMLVPIAERAQSYYDSLFGTQKWNAIISIDNANISKKLNNELTDNAAVHFKTMAFAHPDEYAIAMLEVDCGVNKGRNSIIDVLKYQEFVHAIGGHLEYANWICAIKDENLCEIFNILEQIAMRENAPRFQMNYISIDDSKDFYKLLKTLKESIDK